MVSSKTNLIAHLEALKNVVQKSLLSIVVVFLPMVFFSGELYEWIAEPLLQVMPGGNSMIATEVTSPFLTPLKLTFFVSLALSMPLVLFQMWSFVSPGLYLHEKRLLLPVVMVSAVLFYSGILFAFKVVLPLALDFFVGSTLFGVSVATDISSYLSFILSMFLAFGLAFQVPVVVLILCWAGIVERESLQQKRRHAIVLAFILAMLMTPPDIVSQTMLAFPMLILFELGLVFARIYEGKREASGLEDIG